MPDTPCPDLGTLEPGEAMALCGVMVCARLTRLRNIAPPTAAELREIFTEIFGPGLAVPMLNAAADRLDAAVNRLPPENSYFH